MDVYLSNQPQMQRNWFTFSDERLEQMREELRREDKGHVLNVNEIDYKNYLYARYELIPIQIDENALEIHPPRKEKHQRSSLNEYERNPYYWQCSIACPVKGTTELWGVIPTEYSWGGRPEFAVSGGKLTFVFRIQSQNASEFNRQKDSALDYLKGHTQYVNKDVLRFNASLSGHISTLYNKLKEEYKRENSFFETINVTPNPDAPRTYSVPKVEKRPAIHKPTATSKSFTSEPTVDDKAYNDIVDCLIRTGLSFEQKPSLYVGKDEEALRDLFLVQLELAFTGGTVTGETFNHSGKTDILLKNTDGTNLFVGECKVWKGPKYYHEALTQLLKYLTWDDSKTAVIVFVKDVSLSSVIQTVKRETLSHPSAFKLIDIQRDRFFRFTFTLPQDNQKHISIQVMLFDFDKTTEGRG